MKFSFSHPELNDDEIAAIQHIEEMINQIKLSVVDSNLIVSKETRGLSVKIYPAE
ncbi:MAG: hypothetical protein MJ134_05805 [Lachnospiraceae bacterium]|nr:hypothetical protein [Lachnospiraceae bacterium]